MTVTVWMGQEGLTVGGLHGVTDAVTMGMCCMPQTATANGWHETLLCVSLYLFTYAHHLILAPVHYLCLCLHSCPAQSGPATGPPVGPAEHCPVWG